MNPIRTVTLFLLFLTPLSAFAEVETITRAEGFSRMWQVLQRPIEATSEKPFDDVQEGDIYYALLTYAKRRQFFPERKTHFEPGAPLRTKAALVWLFRTRNIAYPDEITESNIQSFLRKYPVMNPDELSDEELINSAKLNELIAQLDQMLREETHIVSYYADGFEGKGTAFGETFNPDELTAAHLTFPHNTLVRVTNQDNGKQVTVRINDRGPYIKGRSMDLSRAAFAAIGSLGSGLMRNVTFERLGSAEEVSTCPRVHYQRRLGEVTLTPGIPRKIPVGSTVQLSGDKRFRVIQIRGPGMKPLRNRNWTNPGEIFDITFGRKGTYVVIMHEESGGRRRFRTRVSEPCT